MTDETQLVGLAPLFITDTRSLSLLGSGNTDYLDILLDDRVINDGAAAIFAHLCENRSAWDECDFHNLRHTSPLLTMKPCAGFFERLQEQNFCPVVLLPSSAQRFLDSLPRQLRHNLDYYRRRLSTLGDVEIDCANESNFTELFDAFVKLHEARWRTSDMPGVLCDENVQDFHRNAATGFLANGALRLYGLKINGRIIASLYGFHHAARTYYYLGGFDPEFKQYSPGTILITHAVIEAIREGAREFDFLRGREDYKYRWRAVDRTIYRKRLESKSRV
ncbi:MAG TPA: GNAT family N-acetyltransferase [Pyrinomonadaceae bacterium]|nr:GNAT family N-acetyltransferase [Pyrinomonadaceae bacterium]